MSDNTRPSSTTPVPDRERIARARRAQGGAALMVALVMVFMLSILGISAMRGATLESQLANNALHKDMTFQAADSTTDVVLGRANVLEDVICEPDLDLVVTDVNRATGQVTEALVEDGGQTNPVGYSLGGPIGARRFVVTARSALPGASTSTTIAQGVELIGARDQSGGC